MSTGSGEPEAIKVQVLPGARPLDPDLEERIVSSMRRDLIDTVDTPYMSAMAVPEWDDRENPVALTVYLARADIYLLETVRASLDEDGKVTSVDWQPSE